MSKILKCLDFLCFSREAPQLTGNKVALFSYGSGLASSMYSLRISNDLAAVEKLVNSLSHVKPLLAARRKVSPEEFSSTLDMKEKNHHKGG